ncbi:MAG: GFA family protein [Roseitalea porphyridii]|jgi:hypothetical protein|uniref:GFA family protein n=1 Tax=Alphaproteobacteria TaxID=28211 RepID=UPI0032EDC04D
MSQTHRGSCLCGQVRFEITGDFERFYLCHCQRCRKGTGSAHAANLFAHGATLRWLSGEDHLRRYAVPGTRHTRCFCETCGAPVPRVQQDGTLVVVPAGSLDSPVTIRPDAHIFVAGRADWDHALEQVPQVDTVPKP